ncbi:palmitoyl-protein thioesterase [Pisolithus marmoratus]|nr:palmitoyl-protein thioesterase [Pisolithus marmoratus]
MSMDGLSGFHVLMYSQGERSAAVLTRSRYFVMFLALLCVALAGYVVSAPTNDIRPLVVWHGLGDTYASRGIAQFESEVKKLHPDIFVHLVYIDRDAKEDERATFASNYGNVNAQIDLVAEQLASIPELGRGFDAIGFSQGGQFLRGYVERYNDPPVYNLITFGSQHMGISDIPQCRSFDFLCEVARRAAKAGVYTKWAQENLVQAQYFRDPNQLGLYTTLNSFLADINNEAMLPTSRNVTYADNLASLENLILVLFLQDKTVIPKESAWFGSEAPSEEFAMLSTQSDGQQLDDRGAITLGTCPGEHMHLTGCWEDLVRKWVGQPF